MLSVASGNACVRLVYSVRTWQQVRGNRAWQQERFVYGVRCVATGAHRKSARYAAISSSDTIP